MKSRKKGKKTLSMVFVLSLTLTVAIAFAYFKIYYQGQSVSLPYPLTSEGRYISRLKTKLSKLNLKINSEPKLIENTSDVEVVIDPGIKVIFPVKKDIDQEIFTLQLILNKSRIDNQKNGNPKVIDLRTNKPHVTF